MAKPNYQYEKRARELAKKQKKEDKLKRRQENAAHDKGDAGGDSSMGENGESASPPDRPEVP